MAKLEVNIHENTGATKDTAPYLGTFVNKGSIDFATLAEQVSKIGRASCRERVSPRV